MLQYGLSTVARFGQNKLRTLVTGALLAVTPAAVFARHRDFRLDVVAPVPQVIVPCEPAPTQVWIEPVYRDVTSQVWVPAVTRSEVQCVDVPAEYGYRNVLVQDWFGRTHVRREQVLINPAHRESRQVAVVVCGGHYETQTQQVLVREGYWADAR